MNLLRPIIFVSVVATLATSATDRAFGAEPTSVAGTNRPSVVTQKFQSEVGHVLGQMTSTTYRHRTRVVEAAGVYETDCSGLIAFLLRKVSPVHFAVFPIAEGRRKPRAVEYYEFFRAQPAVGQPSASLWNRVPTLAEAQPGDILAWRHREIISGKNTGHVLIIDSVPERTEGDIFRVAVVDSTGTTHDDDTRAIDSSGIGKGVMWFKVNPDRQAVAYERNSAMPFRAAPIEIGRMADK